MFSAWISKAEKGHLSLVYKNVNWHISLRERGEHQGLEECATNLMGMKLGISLLVLLQIFCIIKKLKVEVVRTEKKIL
jgi:hypothetical protein